MKKLLLILTILLSTGCNSFFGVFGGNFKLGPVEHITTGLSPEAQQLVDKAYEGVTKPFDHHIHLIGKDSGNYVNPQMQNPLFIYRYFSYRLYISAGGITDLKMADEQYIERLVSLARSMPVKGRFALYAMEKHYDVNGQEDLSKTPFYVSNDYMMKVVSDYPDIFVPVISIHPYRSDAVERLEYWAKRGVKFIKWLPNSMGIDPSHEKTTVFYETMIRYGMVLLSHTGEESAVPSSDQRLGNPLLLRKPLNMGVQVVALHAASDGDGEDLDSPGEYRSNYELLIRLLRDPRYVANLHAEISATVVYNRMDDLALLLENTGLYHRFINGSDYPVPAINFVIWLKRFEKRGFITQRERILLKEIYKYNPLLFDFVLKRTLRHPKTGARFSASIFESPFE